MSALNSLTDLVFIITIMMEYISPLVIQNGEKTKKKSSFFNDVALDLFGDVN